MLVALLVLGVAMTVIAFLPPLPVILVLCAVVGFVYGPIAPIYNYVMQTHAPAHLRGRVVGVMGSLAYAAGPLGLIVAGPLADAAGLHVDVPGAVAADAAARHRRDLPARAARTWTATRMPAVGQLDRTGSLIAHRLGHL